MHMFENGVIPGISFILDLQGVAFGHVARIGLSQLKNLLFFLQVKNLETKCITLITNCNHYNRVPLFFIITNTYQLFYN